MAFVERKGFGKRLSNSVMGALFGIVMFFGAFALLSWNERDAILQTGAITEIQRVASPDVSSEDIDPANQGQLIHVATEAITDQELEFRDFGVRENAIRLRWDSSIYQWKESKREKDDRTVYEYHRKWVDQPIASGGFRESGHSNEGSTKHFKDGSVSADEVRFGAFRLNKALIGQINDEQPYHLDSSVALDVRPSGHVQDGVFQTGEAGQPEIGDERVEVFMVGPRHNATVMATQKGNSFEAYQTKVGIPKEILYLGLLSKDEVIGKQRTEAALRRWLLRAGGFFCMWFGLSLLFSPLRAAVSFIPFASRILGGAIGFVTFFIALALSVITIAIAWFVVRPILSIGLLVVAAIALFFAFRAKSQDNPSDVTPPPIPPPLPS